LNNDKTSEQSAVLPAQSPTEGGAEDSVAATPVDPQEQYQRLKALREQAEFEAAYERWRQLTEEEREALITSVHATYGTRSANAAASIQQIRAKQSTVKSARTTSERQLDAIDEQEEWEISSVHTQTRTAVKKGEVAATAFESDGEVSARVGASGTSKTTDTYRRRVDPDAARMAIDDERQEVMKDVRDLHRREKRLAGDAALVRNALDAHEHLAAEELSLMSRLDAAFKAGYEPMLKTRRVDEWEDSITQETARFKISSKIWRI